MVFRFTERVQNHALAKNEPDCTKQASVQSGSVGKGSQSSYFHSLGASLPDETTDVSRPYLKLEVSLARALALLSRSSRNRFKAASTALSIAR